MIRKRLNPKVSVCLYNWSAVQASIANDDEFGGVDLVRFSRGQSDDQVKRVCIAAAAKLRELAIRFEKLAGMDNPCKETTQKRANDATNRNINLPLP